MANASSDISAGNTDLASCTEEQSAAVVETAASMEELTSTVKRNADNAREASQLAGLIKESVQRVMTGSEMANKAGTTMEQIVSSVTNVSGNMNEISSASEEQRY